MDRRCLGIIPGSKRIFFFSFIMEMWFRWHATPWEPCPVIAETLPEGDEYGGLLPHKLFWSLKLTMVEQILLLTIELKPGGRNMRVTEETKHEYVDLVADHILTNAIRPQINSFLDGFNELVPRELISIFNDKELELLISSLPEIDSSNVQWFWEVVMGFNEEDMARLLQFVTGTSKLSKIEYYSMSVLSPDDKIFSGRTLLSYGHGFIYSGRNDNIIGETDDGNQVVKVKEEVHETDAANQILSSLTSIGSDCNKDRVDNEEQEERSTILKRLVDGPVTFTKFAEKQRRPLNAFVRQIPSLLEKSLSMLLKAPRLIDFDNKRAYFTSRIRQQHDQQLSGPLRISVRWAYILEDSYKQLRMCPNQDLKERLIVHFHGEEGIDACGLTREWYQLIFVGRVNSLNKPNFELSNVAKALFDGQLLDVYFTRSFYKHILGVKVTYHHIEAVDPDYYKNLKWMLENDVSDTPDLTFSMDPDDEKHILYEKTEITDYEFKPGGRNMRVMEEIKHEYVDLVADHILTNAIRPQINSFLDVDDLKANTEYTGYTAASNVVQWFWEVVK
ncbi:hypothetical protein BUALT_Bualt02G0009500 [Buddleja alternifolia]|uniref:HECT-type E3 ubiquitin transferase n=1 Tax=Buddleja alternifolia TaxID=168488 RepID=A0AAV6Y7A3_9LAMI|nr:hypothetical protein BUALT_Bualt02G0009500 [Buddleja alternifolia]